MNLEPRNRRRNFPLRILQQNANKSRLYTDHFTNARLHLNYDLICIQEPYTDRLDNTRATSSWRVIYPTSRRTSRPQYRAVTLINVKLDTNMYRQVPFPDPDVVAVQLRSLATDTAEAWSCTVINVYNDLVSQATLEKIDHFLQHDLPRGRNDYIVLLGDFNRHHAMWELDANTRLTTQRHEEHAQPLLDILANHSLIMTLPQGVHTLELKSDHTVITRPDNVFCSTRMTDMLTRCEVDHHRRGPGVDHYPISTTIDLVLERKPTIHRRNFKEVEWKEFEEVLEGKMSREGRRWQIGEIKTEEDFNAAVECLVEDIRETI
jgi:exonuclease III